MSLFLITFKVFYNICMNKHLYVDVPIANPVPLETLPNREPIAQTSDGGRKQVPALGLTSPECPWAKNFCGRKIRMYVRIGVTDVKFGTILEKKNFTAFTFGWDKRCDPY
jgi:hypothetical protein